jgi:DNA-binding transcriptional LysR family regulator
MGDAEQDQDIAAAELIDLESIRRSVVVAEELNFTRAAARLGLAQPPLSAAISKLERRLGVRLLERTSRQVTLTPAGAVLLRQGRIAVEAAGAAVQRTRRAATQPARLTVAVKPGTGTDLLRRIVRRYAQDPRRPQVRLLFGHPGGPAAAVRGGAADVAILRAPFDQRGLDTELLLTEPRVAVLPAHHRLAAQAELCRADLSGEPMPHWSGPSDPAATAYWTGALPATALSARTQTGTTQTGTTQTGTTQTGTTQTGTTPGTETPAGPEINDISQLLDAVAVGGAVAYVPASLAEEYRSAAGLVFVPVTDVSPSQVVAAWPATSRSRAVAAFVRAAAEAAAEATVRAPG